jgi:amidohydrolase
MNVAEIKAKVCSFIDAHQTQFMEAAAEIHAHPEVAFTEHHAQAKLTGLLEEWGFAVERGTAELDTAWKATDGQDGPRIAILSEYDALPQIGHACGHNLIGTGGVLAAIALKAAWPDHPGQVLSIGTPAEEGGGGKVLMVDRGAFAGVDAAMMFHPSGRQTIAHRHALAAQGLRIKFRGKPAHAAARPWYGVNALDAVCQFFVSVAMLRQQVRPDARLHGIITNGGSAANVIPEETEALYRFRALDRVYLNDLKEKVRRCAEAAAMATGCTVEFQETLLYTERRNNMVMANAFRANIEELGEEVSEPDPNGSVGSSDIGNVSLLVPTIHPYVKIADEEIAGHTAEFRLASCTPYAYIQMLKAAKAMAMTAVDLLAAPGVLEAARAEFRAAEAAK